MAESEAIAAEAGAGVVAAASGLAFHRHRNAKGVIAREGERFGWDDARRAHELRALKRRHGLFRFLRRRR